MPDPAQQPKCLDLTNGEWLVASSATDPGLPPSDEDADQSIPLGFRGTATGLVSPRPSATQAAFQSGSWTRLLSPSPVAPARRAFSAFLVSSTVRFPPVTTNWEYSIWIEHGENNLPTFRMVNDSEEYIVDGRLRLIGWKYRIVELSMAQLAEIKSRTGGRLTFKIINPAGIPTTGSLLAEYFPK